MGHGTTVSCPLGVGHGKTVNDGIGKGEPLGSGIGIGGLGHTAISLPGGADGQGKTVSEGRGEGVGVGTGVGQPLGGAAPPIPEITMRGAMISSSF